MSTEWILSYKDYCFMQFHILMFITLVNIISKLHEDDAEALKHIGAFVI
jgi:hypothetical protein